MLLTTGIRVLIVDDHPVVRLSLQATIDRQSDMTAVAAVGNLGQALLVSATDLPDVILLDLKLPDTPPEQAVTQIRQVNPAGRILLLSTDEAGEDLCRALDVGADGCVSRTAEMEEIVSAIRTVHAEKPWLSPEAAAQLGAYRVGARLTEEELAYLRLLVAGRNNQQIAAAVGWSECQVRSQMRRIQAKLQAKNETHMLITALRRGIVSLE